MLDNDALGCQLPMESGVNSGVEWHEIVGHDASATIDRTVFAECFELQGVGKMDTVGIGQFPTLQTVQHIHRIILGITFLIWLLDTTA